MSELYQSLSRSKWDCKYHVVFIPKRRKKSIFGALRRHVGEIFRELARHKEAEVVEGHLMPDHVHMCISIPPKIAVANAVGYIKGKSAIAIARKFAGRARNFTERCSGPAGISSPRWGLDEDMVRAYNRHQESEDGALRPNEARHVGSRHQAAYGVRAPLRRSPNKPPALPGVT